MNVVKSIESSSVDQVSDYKGQSSSIVFFALETGV